MSDVPGKDRRQFLARTATAGASVVIGTRAFAAPKEKQESEAIEVTPTEDLMREHGVLERVLLIYEELERRMGKSPPPPSEVIAASAGVVKRFIEQYHERLEEEQVFPRLEKARQLADLTKTLREQHAGGRALTAQILEGVKGRAGGAPSSSVAPAMAAFIRMYRPHAAREDTVLFPAFHALFSEKDFRELGERFEDQEHKLLGSSGFEGVVAEIGQMERELGIYDLAQFTPAAPGASRKPG